MLTKTRQKRFAFLLSAHFLPWEAHHLSALKMDDPAVRQMMAVRRAARDRFVRRVSSKVASGAWSQYEAAKRWISYLSGVYTRRNWRVQAGPVGGQPAFRKGAPNPFAMYRYYEKGAPHKRHVSPWEVRAWQSKEKRKLITGLVATQVVERNYRAGKVNQAQVAGWISEKRRAVAQAKGARRKELLIQLRRLEALLC